MFFIFFLLLLPCAMGKFDYVIEVNKENFPDISKSGQLWFLFFRSSKYSDLSMESYNKVGKALDGFAKFGVVDIEMEPALAFQCDVRKINTLKAFKNDTNLFDYELEYPSKEELIDSAIKAMSDQINEEVKEKLVEGDFVKEFINNETDIHVKYSPRRWLILYYVSDYSETGAALAKMWESVAKSLHEKISFGAYDVSNSVEDYTEIYDKIPTIRYHYGTKEISDEYNGPMEHDAVFTWALDLIKQPRVHEVRNERLLRDKCIKYNYCVITVMPSTKVCDFACYMEEKNNIRNFANAYKQYSWSWIMYRAGDLPLADKILDVYTKEMHVVRMVHVRTLMSKHMNDPSEEDMKRVFEDVASGKGFIGIPLHVFENIEEQYKPWHDEL